MPVKSKTNESAAGKKPQGKGPTAKTTPNTKGNAPLPNAEGSTSKG